MKTKGTAVDTKTLKRVWETALREAVEKHPWLIHELDWFRASPQPCEAMKKAA